MNNVDKTIISQYINSPHLREVIGRLNEAIDPGADIDQFYSLVWNVETAEGYGLDVWGRIVGVNRVLKLPNGMFWGFAEATVLSAAPYNQAPFYSGQQTTSNFRLDDKSYRTLIYAKALANISDGSIPSINRILRLLFPGRGNCYVVDNLDMTMTYTFDFILDEVEATIVTQSKVLPQPSGVETFFSENGVLIGNPATALFSITRAGTAIGVMAPFVAMGISTGDVTLTVAPNVPVTPDPTPVTPVTPTPTTSLTYLTAQGAALKDASGATFIPKAINWYGFEQILVAGGLWNRPYKTITVAGVVKEGLLDQVKRMGFNCIRFPICQDITWTTSGPPTTQNPWTPANGRKPSTNTTDWNYVYINPDLNPDFFTTPGIYNAPQPFITSLEMLDKFVAYMGTIGLRAIFDMHCLAPNNSDIRGNSPNGDYTKKLWYTTANRMDAGQTAGVRDELRSEPQAINNWTFLANRYKNNPVVMGFDLINEPAGGTWATTDAAANLATDLPAYYARCGNAIHAVNPDVMIICEGTADNVDYGATPCGYGNANGGEPQTYGVVWSGCLTGVASRPVVLQHANKVIYSPHEYGSYGGEAYGYCPASFKAFGAAKAYAHQWFYSPIFPSNMANTFSKAWGFIAEQGIAPVLIGEIGCQLITSEFLNDPNNPNYTDNHVAADVLWIAALADYIKAFGIGFAIWCLNPGGTPRGILDQDTSNGGEWSTTPHADQMWLYSKLLKAFDPPPTITWLKTNGNKLIDQAGNQFVPRAVDVYGFDVCFAPQGGYSRSFFNQPGQCTHETPSLGLIDEVAWIGFNMVRLGVCIDLTWAGARPSDVTAYYSANFPLGVSPNGPYTSAYNPCINPEFWEPDGLTPKLGLVILDMVIAKLKSYGIRVMLDIHCAAPNTSDVAGFSSDPNNSLTKLWYTTATPGAAGGTTRGKAGEPRNEAQWRAAAVTLCSRYGNEPAVFAIDLCNEPAGTTWDNDPNTGWAAAAERCIADIRAVNTNIIVVVEGTQNRGQPIPNILSDGTGDYAVWGSDIRGATGNNGAPNRPIVDSTPNKLAYSAHEYGSYAVYSYTNDAAQFAHHWFADPQFPNGWMSHVWDNIWGDPANKNIAPVIIGEIASSFALAPDPVAGRTPAHPYASQHYAADKKWWADFLAYCKARNIGITWFALPSGGGTGVLADNVPYDNYHQGPRMTGPVSTRLVQMLSM